MSRTLSFGVPFALLMLAGAAVVLSEEPSGFPYLPDPKLTPGVAAETHAAIICAKGYAKAHRPTEDLEHVMKLAILDRYHIARSSIYAVQGDALIPICLGGNHYDQRNLWPQPFAGQWNAHMKDNLERQICREDCDSGDDAQIARDQHAFATNWIALWKERTR